MPLHYGKFPVPVEKIPRRFFVRQVIISLKLGQDINFPAQSLYFRIIIFRYPPDGAAFSPAVRFLMDEKIKLHLLPVHTAVQVHDTAFRTAKA